MYTIKVIKITNLNHLQFDIIMLKNNKTNIPWYEDAQK